ncbi:MAG TPA: hypothetical protein VIL34_14270 [Actinopolymorphaceae bacterium]
MRTLENVRFKTQGFVLMLAMKRSTGVRVIVCAVMLTVLGCQSVSGVDSQEQMPQVPSTCGYNAKLVPSCGAWWGVAANPLVSGQTWPQALANFENLIRRPVNIAHFYHRAPQLFPTPQEIAIANQPGRERILFINYKPEMGHTWIEVARGAVDHEIDRLAAHIRANFRKPFFLTVHHEPEEEVKGPGTGYSANDYRLMYRHVMIRLYNRGVRNIIRVMNYMGLPQWGSTAWFRYLYPGDDVVDWIAQDPYIFGTGEYWGDISSLMNRRFARYPSWPGFYSWATSVHPGKPIMLAEWGVSERPGSPGAKAQFFTQLGQRISQWPRVKALVYWNHPSGRTVGATRIDSSSTALNAYRSVGLRSYFNPP